MNGLKLNAAREARNAIELADHRLARVLDMLGHRVSKLEPQRVADHLAGLREDLREALAWLRAVEGQVSGACVPSPPPRLDGSREVAGGPVKQSGAGWREE